MRSIQVCTEVYAAIWAAREAGEENEDAILGRIFKIDDRSSAATAATRSSGIGVVDGRSGVHFGEGFEIFRRYKGQEFRATARGGQWVRQDSNKAYPSLNRLNTSIVSGQENVWNGNWKFRNNDGAEISINSLRN